MAAIQRALTIGFRGETHEIQLSMDLINRIELAGVNLLKLQMMVDESAIPPTSLISSFYAILLQHAGVDVDAEDVWAELIHKDPIGTINSAKTALASMFPSSKEDPIVKKPEAEQAKK